MENISKSLVSASSEINEIFLQLEKNVAAPVLDVPTPLESSRPSANADKLHYRHQPIINSVFKIPFSPDAEFKSLCQDCFRVVCHPTKQAMEMARDQFFFCDCGGDLWPFNCGAYEIARLFSLDSSALISTFIRLGLIKPINGPFIYFPATGIVREQPK